MAADLSSDPPSAGRLVEWDSTFFGRVIARIEPDALVRDARAVERWCQGAGVSCAYLLADTADQPAIDAAQAAGFQLVDVRLTMETSLARRRRLDRAGDVRVRRADAADLNALQVIARASHHDTRFYVDQRFGRERADDLYDLWITKSCQGWADTVLVAEIDGGAAGYITCHLRPAEGEIGLVGVDSRQRNRGAGAAMVEAALDWFASAGVARVAVATQGRNNGALRLYGKSGFGVRSIALWYHKWW